MRKALAGLGVAALVAASLFTGSAAGAEESPDVGAEAFGQPVINEVATRGPAGSTDEFVEVANPNMVQAANIGGWQVRIYDASCSLVQTITIPLATVLQPLGAASPDQSYWTISSPGYTGAFVDQPGAINAIPDNGAVALFNPGGAQVDALGYNPFCSAIVEGQAVVPQSPQLDLFSPAYGRDMLSSDFNQNSFDFKLLVRTPDQPN